MKRYEEQRTILNEQFTKLLHKKMFCHVWRWAGKFRQSEKNLGVPFFKISIELKTLCDDVQYWIDHQTFEHDEIAARFHHRLVAIHPFSNGNGRHARLMTDIVLVHLLGRERFSWGQENLTNAGDCRRRYIEALRSADLHDYGPLLAFVRS